MQDRIRSRVRARRPYPALVILASLVPVGAASAIDPKPSVKDATWAGQSWGELQVTPAITKSTNSFTARAIVRGGPAGDPQWRCSQYSGWVAAGTTSIAIVIPTEWQFTSGPGFVRTIGGRASIKDFSAGDPPPLGWEDRVSDTCYCSIDTFGASGGCETREIVPTLGSTHQEEILATQATGQWVEIQAEFYGWNSVGHSDYATNYVLVVDETEDLEDNDNDGLGDAWEVAHFGDLTTANATSSYPDGDEFNDLTEYNRWKNNTLDDDGQQYDPTAKNVVGGATGGSTDSPLPAPACGSAIPFAMMMSFAGLVLMSVARKHERR